jgi:hypothetical protein
MEKTDMTSRSLELRAARTILAADRTIADQDGPHAVRRLETATSGVLLLLKLHMNRAALPATALNIEDFAAGYTPSVEVETWHPVRAGGPKYSVPQVLVQLPESLRGQVAAVEFVELVEDGLTPFDPHPGEAFPLTWAVFKTRLYRHAIQLPFVEEKPLKLPDGAFKHGSVRLVVEADQEGGRWAVRVHVDPLDGERGAMVGMIMTTEVAMHDGAGNDALETARTWIGNALPATVFVSVYRCLTQVSPPSDGVAGHAAGEMLLLRG